MTNEEIKAVAKEVAMILSQNAPEKPSDAPTIVSAPEKDSVHVNINPDTVQTNEEPDSMHTPAVSAEQLVDILNDVRLIVRAQYKQPWVKAIEVLFQNPAAYATVNGKRRPLIDAHQVNAMIESLKESGKFWPQIVVTAVNENGDRQYVNSSYKREDGDRWKLGSVMKPEAETAK